jgi:hypothetical protein
MASPYRVLSSGPLGIDRCPLSLRGKDMTKDSLHIRDRARMSGDALSTKLSYHHADG